MGLAFQPISVFNARPYFQTLIAQHRHIKKRFGFYLAQSGSELFLGGADRSKYRGKIHWNDVTVKVRFITWIISNFRRGINGPFPILQPAAFWQIKLDKVSVNGKTIATGLSSIIDSGTTLIVGDDANVAKFYASVGGKPYGTGGLYTGM